MPEKASQLDDNQWITNYGGGAWKVAYADFVTSMMALFLVLWILSQDEEVIIATTMFFQDPYKAGIPKSSAIPNPDGRKGSMVDQIMGRSDTTMKNTNETSSIDISILYQMAQEFYRLLQIDETDINESVEIDVTSDGLRLTLFDKNDMPIFENDSSTFTEWGEVVMQNMAWLLERHNMKVRIDAFTASKKPDDKTTDIWKITADQGNAARSMLTYYALDPNKIERVTSFGDTLPKDKQDLQSDRNKRLEMSLVLEKD